MARLHAITGSQWCPTVRITGKNILGFGKTVRGAWPIRLSWGTLHNSFKSSELMVTAAER
jgi:hypothetical protein